MKRCCKEYEALRHRWPGSAVARGSDGAVRSLLLGQGRSSCGKGGDASPLWALVVVVLLGLLRCGVVGWAPPLLLQRPGPDHPGTMWLSNLEVIWPTVVAGSLLQQLAMNGEELNSQL